MTSPKHANRRTAPRGEKHCCAADFDLTWQGRARCRGMAADIFFACDHDRGQQHARHEANAKRICHNCPVLRQCRDYALAAREPYGIWGATTPRERAHLRRRTNFYHGGS